jgi:hypothetical protein
LFQRQSFDLLLTHGCTEKCLAKSGKSDGRQIDFDRKSPRQSTHSGMSHNAQFEMTEFISSTRLFAVVTSAK